MSIAETYYQAMIKKDVQEMGKYLHPEVEFISPLGNLKGKEAVIQAAKKATGFFDTMTIRKKFESGNQAFLVLDMQFPAPIGFLPTASLVTLNGNLISRIELFYDGRALEASFKK